MPTPQTRPFDDVDVESEVVDVQLRVGGVLPRHQQDPTAMTAYGGQSGGDSRERRRRRDRVVGVDLAEPVGGCGDPVRGEVRLQEMVQWRAEPRGHLLDRELDPELLAEDLQDGAEADGGVDQRHVEVEPDHQPLLHPTSVGRTESRCRNRAGPSLGVC